MALSESNKAYRRRAINACIEEQQTAYDNAKSGWDKLSKAERLECAQRFRYSPNLIVVGNCVSQKLMQHQRDDDLDRPRSFQR